MSDHASVQAMQRALDAFPTSGVTCGGAPSDPGCGDAADYLGPHVVMCGECRGHALVLHFFACTRHAEEGRAWVKRLAEGDFGSGFHDITGTAQGSPVTAIERHLAVEPY